MWRGRRRKCVERADFYRSHIPELEKGAWQRRKELGSSITTKQHKKSEDFFLPRLFSSWAIELSSHRRYYRCWVGFTLLSIITSWIIQVGLSCSSYIVGYTYEWGRQIIAFKDQLRGLSSSIVVVNYSSICRYSCAASSPNSYSGGYRPADKKLIRADEPLRRWKRRRLINMFWY